MYSVDLSYSLAALVLIWVLIFVFWRDYRVDLLRARLSVLRDELTGFAFSGGIPPTHPAYTIALELVDDSIDCADRFTWLRVLCFWAARRSASRRPLDAWAEALSTLPDGEARNFLAPCLERWRRTLVSHLLLGAPVPGVADADIGRQRSGWLDVSLPSAWPGCTRSF